MLNKKPSSLYADKAALIIAVVLLICSGCGKRKLPQPPSRSVSPTAEITGIQKGSTIILSWKLPVRRPSDSNDPHFVRADIYRLVEPLNASLTLSEEEFSSQSTLISTVPISADDSLQREQLTYTDTLDVTGQNIRLRYAVRLVNNSGQKAMFSNFLLIEPTAKAAVSPNLLNAKISEQVVYLQWNAPDKNIDNSKPANIIGYNVYRASEKDFGTTPLNNSPIIVTNFSDQTFKFGTKYNYFVRAISVGGSGDPIESLNSNTIEVAPIDVFAPTAPSALTIAASPGSISIFFAANLEKDVAGYRVYRSTTFDLPKSEWTLLTRSALTTNTFQDRNVKPEETYFYYIIAIDSAGNISPPSAVVSETVPK